MRTLGIAFLAAAVGVAAGIFLGREYFGRSLQANIAVSPGVDVSLVGESLENLIIVRNNDDVLDFESPCVSRQMRRDDAASDYSELIGRLPSEAKENTHFDGSRAVSVSFSCQKLLYSLSFDEDGHTSSISIRSY